jgi:copper transport protein
VTRRVARVVSVTVLAGMILLAGASAASAHALLASSDPADGAVLPTAPSAVTLTFTEPPDPSLSSVQVLDAGGGVIADQGLERIADKTLRLPLPSGLPDGVYTVSWQVVSAADGHSTSNVFAFAVGETTGQAPMPSVSAPTTPGPTVLGVAGKVLLYAGLALLVALAIVGVGAFGARLTSARVVVLWAAVLALGGAILMLFDDRTKLGVSMSDLLRSEAGGAYVRLLIAVTVATGFAVLAAARPGTTTFVLAGITGLAAMVVRTFGGHAAAASTVQELLQSVHFAAAGTWVGGLILLALLLRERRTDPPARDAARFSTIAGICVAIIVVTGSLRALNEIGSIGKLFDTAYGVTLSVKVGLALVLIGLGAINRYRSLPRLARGEGSGLLRHVVAAELVTALGIFALTGTITGLAPQAQESHESHNPSPSAVTVEGADFATTMRVMLTATPGAVGPNDFEVHVTDYDTGEPIHAAAVSLRFDPVAHGTVASSSLPLSPTDHMWTGSGTQLSLGGTWTVTARVRIGDATTEIPLILITRVPGATTSVSANPGLPTLYTTTMPDGAQAQVYVDPGTQGPNQIHLTAFDDNGATALPLASATFVAVPPDGTPIQLDAVRFAPEHFVANTDLKAGDWTFDVTAQAKDGRFLQATVQQTIGAT